MKSGDTSHNQGYGKESGRNIHRQVVSSVVCYFSYLRLIRIEVRIQILSFCELQDEILVALTSCALSVIGSLLTNVVDSLFLYPYSSF